MIFSHHYATGINVAIYDDYFPALVLEKPCIRGKPRVMPNLISVKVDLNKIDEKRIFHGKNGARYLDLVLMPLRELGKFGDTHLVKQSVSKEERLAKVQTPIIGNATERVWGDNQNTGNQEQRPAVGQAADNRNEEEPPPF